MPIMRRVAVVLACVVLLVAASAGADGDPLTTMGSRFHALGGHAYNPVSTYQHDWTQSFGGPEPGQRTGRSTVCRTHPAVDTTP